MPDSTPSMNAPAWAVIPAGGSGSRFSESQDKLQALLAGCPVLIHTLQALLNVPSIQGVILVSSKQHISVYQALVQKWLPDASIQFALGGDNRRDSVYQGLLALPPEASIVVVHDAARPLIQPEPIAAAIAAVQQDQAAGAIVAVPIHDTVKQVNTTSNHIQATLDRRCLWRAQTPQVFAKHLLLKAHESISANIPITDDAQLLELADMGPVRIIPGNERNLKITTQTDLLMAEAFLQAARTPLV